MNYLSETLTIGVLAEAAGVNVETIRFYQRKGLMQEPDRPLGAIPAWFAGSRNENAQPRAVGR